VCWAYDDDAFLGAAAGRFLAGGPARGERGLCVGDRVIDHFIAHGPGMTAMCAYRSDLGHEALTDVASAPPLVHAGAGVPPFQVFFDDHRLTLAGSVDTFGAGRLARMLATSPVEGPVAVLDLGRLDFVDAAGCRTIALWGRDLADHAVGLEIRGASTLVRRVWRLLALTEIAPVHFPEDDR
jgi:hypothetical protein